MGQLDALFEKSKEATQEQVLPSPHNIPDTSNIDAILGNQGTPVGGPEKPAASAITGEALIAMLDGMTPMVVRLICMRYKVRFTAEITRECRLSEAEKQQLRLTADAAAPVVARLLQQSQNISVGIFFISYVMIVGSKIHYIKSMAPPETPSEPPQAEQPAEDVDGGNPASQKRVYNKSGKFRGVAQARRSKATVTSTATGNGVQA